VVAGKSPAIAKSRLGRLGDVVRNRLAEAFADDLLACLSAVPRIGHVALLTDPEGWSKPPGTRRVHVIHDQKRGLNAEFLEAAVQMPRPLVLMTADLPSVRPDEIDQLLLEAATVDVGVVPDHTTRGTTALTFTTPETFAAFGPQSHLQHQDLGAMSIGWSLAGLRLDVDEPEDLVHATAQGVGVETRRVLRSVPSAGGLTPAQQESFR
jgi:2-phospho-L-lactate guanylyltransferase